MHLNYLLAGLLAAAPMNVWAAGTDVVSRYTAPADNGGVPPVVMLCPSADGSRTAVPCPVSTAQPPPPPATTTQSGGTTNATAGTFNQIAPADTARKLLRIVNTSNDYMYVYLGTSATPTPANSEPILPGNSWPPPLSVVPQDAIFLAAKSLASAPYVLMVFR